MSQAPVGSIRPDPPRTGHHELYATLKFNVKNGKLRQRSRSCVGLVDGRPRSATPQGTTSASAPPALRARRRNGGRVVPSPLTPPADPWWPGSGFACFSHYSDLWLSMRYWTSVYFTDKLCGIQHELLVQPAATAVAQSAANAARSHFCVSPTRTTGAAASVLRPISTRATI